MRRRPHQRADAEWQQQHSLTSSHSKEPEAVRIGLLGGFRVSVGPRVIQEDQWRLRKAASLVKLLALAPNQRLHREQVMEWLWPDLEAKAASNNLHRTLHFARRLLNPEAPAAAPYLQLQGNQLALCPEEPLWVDVEAFEEVAAVARRSHKPAAYRAALELYAGDLLPEDRYEPWAEGRREELRHLHLALLVELAALYEQRGEELGLAIEMLRKVVTNEPTNEEAHVGLMRLYATNDQRHRALRQYEELREALRKELGSEPDAESRRLFQEIVEGRFPPARTSAPQGRSPEEPPPGDHSSQHNLPTALSTFVGREREILEVKRALAMTRLLTLTGTGGSGKTRLALEVAKDLVGAYPDGVWMVELASLSEGSLVAQAVASALGVREQPGRPLAATLMDALKSRNMLLVLDNCEHLIEASAELVEALLRACPRLRILATSREALGVSGEASWPVPSLSVPYGAEEELPSMESLTHYEAVRLFLERARLKLPTFELTPTNARAVAEVCRKLEGIPLAIELAAARAGSLAVEQIPERLSDSLKLLTGGSRTALPRQQTLRGALDWSYQLLEELERDLFRRLSVFAGGWTLEAAEAVGAGGGIEEDDVLNLLSRLVDKSLVVTETTAGEQSTLRYRLLEPVRQYSREKLEESGEAASVRWRHATFFLGLAEEAEPGMRGPQQEESLERLEREHDNLRAALRWSLEREEAELGLQLSGALGEFWHLRGYLDEGQRQLEAALAKGEALPAPMRAKALVEASMLAWEKRDYERAVALGEEGLALSREIGDTEGIARSLFNLGTTAMFQNELEKAEELLEEAATLQRESGDEFGLARTMHVLGLTVMSRHDYERAEALREESLALAQKMGDRATITVSGGLGALIALGRGDYERAKVIVVEGLKMSRRLGYRHYFAPILHILASAAGSQGQPVRAARLWGAAETIRETMGVALAPVERACYAPHIAAARSRLDEAAWEEAWAEGREMSLEEALEYALAEEEPTPSASVTSRATLSQASERKEAELGLRLSGVLGEFWKLHGHVDEGLRWLEAALAKGEALPTPVRIKALAEASRLALEKRNLKRAIAFGEEGLALAREAGDMASIAGLLYNLGTAAMFQNELERAEALLEEAATLQRELGDEVGLARTLQALGMTVASPPLMSQRHLERAEALHNESLALARKTGNSLVIDLLGGLGAHIALRRGDYERAKAICAQGLKMSQQVGRKHLIAPILQELATVVASEGRSVRAALLWGAAEAQREALGAVLTPVERSFYGPYMTAAQAQLGEDAWQKAWAEGRAMSEKRAIQYALEEESVPPRATTPVREQVPASSSKPVNALTRREREVALLVAEGLTNRRIASELRLSEHTVATHVGKILRKLGLSSRTQISAWAAERRLLS